MTPDEVDALLQQLPTPTPSPRLRDRVLGEIGRRTAVRRPRRAVRGLALAVALSGFAAVLWVILPKSPDVAPVLPSGKGQDENVVDLKFARVEWSIHSNQRRPLRMTISHRLLFIENEDGTLMALDRQTGRSAWMLRSEDGAMPDWPPVTAQGVPEELERLEDQLRQINLRIEEKLREVGPGAEAQTLQVKRNEVRERMRIAAYGDGVYFISRGLLTCVDRTNGALKWTNRLQFVPSGPPCALRSYLFVPEAAGPRVHVLSVEERGAEVANYAPPTAPRANAALGGPVYADPSVYFVAPDGTLYCYRITDGNLVWLFETEPGKIAGPSVHVQKFKGVTTRLLLFAVARTLYAMDADAGRLLWKSDVEAPLAGAPIVRGDRVYVGTGKQEVLAFEMTGRLLWRLRDCERFLMAGRKVVYLLGVNKEILAVNEAAGEIVDRFPVGAYTQFHSTSDGLLYAVRPGALVCFKERE